MRPIMLGRDGALVNRIWEAGLFREDADANERFGAQLARADDVDFSKGEALVAARRT